MTPDAQETVGRCAGFLAITATSLRTVAASDGVDKREADGLTLMAEEVDAIIEGLGNVSKP